MRRLVALWAITAAVPVWGDGCSFPTLKLERGAPGYTIRETQLIVEAVHEKRCQKMGKGKCLVTVYKFAGDIQHPFGRLTFVCGGSDGSIRKD